MRSTSVLAALLALVTVPLAAQQSASPGSAVDWSTPFWMEVWSPLLPPGDLINNLPSAPPRPDLLVTPPPEVGLLWTAGVTAGLPFEVESARTEFRGLYRSDSGRYRRPLDPADAGSVELSALGWRQLGGAGAVIGRAAFDSESFQRSSFSHVEWPYTSSPLMPTDTSSPSVGRSRVRLEGAGGWRLESWGLGLAAGYEALDNHSRQTGLARTGRAATFGASAALVRAFLEGAVRVAAYGRVRGREETVWIVSNPESGTAHQFAGYSEPEPIEITPTTGPHRRRIGQDGWAAGLAAAGELAGVKWAAFAELSGMDEAQSSQLRNNPPKDRWSTSGHSFGGSLQWRLGHPSALITGGARRTSLSGDARRADLPGVLFRGNGFAQLAWAEIRIEPRPIGWGGAVRLSGGQQEQNARDNITEFCTGIRHRWAGVALEFARSFSEKLAASVGPSVNVYWGERALPDSVVAGPLYQQVIAPELSLHSADTIAWAILLSARWRLSTISDLLLQGGYGALAPRDELEGQPLPTGERESWAVSMGIAVRR